jgi:2-(1,2-epoxy-1,2-dihydrophenyl)acetyl-CoA isomerase
MTSLVLVEMDGATRFATLNRPEARNALTGESLTELTDVMRNAARDPTVRCVIIAGSGGHFCAGADLRLTPLDGPQLADRLDAFQELLRSVVLCPKPTIAMMDGAAVGFGADLAFACDLRIASTRAYAQEKFVNIGLMPDGGGTFFLPRLVGTARAMQMMLLAEPIDASELHRLGVVARVVDKDALREAALEVARRIEAGPPRAFAAIKRSVHASWGSLEDALRRERQEQLDLLRSADVREGISAWAERRAPRFEGR